jgi:S-adenosylmethionine hydrolase
LTNPVVTLLSDFGMKDPYVAEMKAVIMKICPKASIVDLSHEIEKFNILMGAFVLASASPYFPKGTIHVGVVDPGVGTKRRPILVETRHSFYVGPDNGLIMLAAKKQGINHAYYITNPHYMLSHISKTFHGRDIFASAAAHLALGSNPADFGPEIHDYAIPKFSEPQLSENGLRGEVIHIDDFGNVILNVSAEDWAKARIKIGSTLKLRFENKKAIILKFCSTYGEAQLGKPLVLIGSHNFLEISVNQANASKKFRTKAGDAVSIIPVDTP